MDDKYYRETPEGDLMPDADEMIRELVQQYMVKAGVGPEWIAARCGRPTKEIKGFLRGKPLSLNAAVSFAYMRGTTVEDMLLAHPAYRTTSREKLETHVVVSLKDRLLQLVGNMMTSGEVRTLYNVLQMVQQFPELGTILHAGRGMAMEIARQKGVDTDKVTSELLNTFKKADEQIERMKERKLAQE